jgi:para-aminobenzoate synthetase component 1
LKSLSTSQAGSSPVVYELGQISHPAQLFSSFQDMPSPALLDGAMLGASGNRYSYLTADPFLVIRSRGRQITFEHDGICDEVEDDPWSVLQGFLRRYRTAQIPGLPSFQGGALGYWGYDLGKHLERLPSLAYDDIQVPEMYLGLYDWALAYDSDTNLSYLFSTGLPNGTLEHAEARAKVIMDRLEREPLVARPSEFNVPASLKSNFTVSGYESAVGRVKEYLAAGDSYQVNLSQRFQAPFEGDPWSLYLKLRELNPAPFAAYLSFPELSVLSVSPEEFLNLEQGRVRSRPIKGTRPVGATSVETARYSEELLANDKERAENVMIVDLIRNDLGRVCNIGSVEVTSLLELEQHPTVLHLVSTVIGELPLSADAVDLLKACFPGGSVTGVPKLRSMEIIEELETVRRGVYCGAIGYISFGGDMGTSIAIRTLVLTGGQVYLQVGGGIVADSDPLAEYQETLQKGKGLRLSLGFQE